MHMKGNVAAGKRVEHCMAELVRASLALREYSDDEVREAHSEPLTTQMLLGKLGRDPRQARAAAAATAWVAIAAFEACAVQAGLEAVGRGGEKLNKADAILMVRTGPAKTGGLTRSRSGAWSAPPSCTTTATRRSLTRRYTANEPANGHKARVTGCPVTPLRPRQGRGP